MSSMLDLSRKLTEAVAATDGVNEVYPTTRFRELMAGTRRESDSQAARVSVHQRGAGLAVYANICVDSQYPLPLVLRTVSDAISRALAAADSGPAHIAVTASRIQ